VSTIGCTLVIVRIMPTERTRASHNRRPSDDRLASHDRYLPGLKTVDGIAQAGPNQAAWMKDSEGNVLGIVQFSTEI
jgi:hypothetical protein